MPYPEFTTEELASEEWRPVIGYEHYLVSSVGRVKNVRSGHILRPELTGMPKSKYLSVILSFKGTTRHRKVHQLVLEAFIGPRPVGQVANHKNGNRLCNTPVNLEWTTRSGNAQHALTELGTFPHGETSTSAKLTDAAVMDIRIRLARGDRVDFNAVAKQYGVDRRNVRAAACGETWKHLPVTVTKTAQYAGLSPDTKAAIRTLLSQHVKQKDIASQFGISEALVSAIRHGHR